MNERLIVEYLKNLRIQHLRDSFSIERHRTWFKKLRESRMLKTSSNGLLENDPIEVCGAKSWHFMNDSSGFLQRRGMIVAQCMFQGSIKNSGQGNSGGLGVFLGALGDAIGKSALTHHVYTLEFQNCGDDYPTSEARTSNHTVIKVPLVQHQDPEDSALADQELVFEQSLASALAHLQLKPDVFHIRYSDSASLAAANLAKKIGASLVFTVTADPHRFIDKRRLQSNLENHDLVRDMKKIQIADQLVDMADGLVAISNSDDCSELEAYFPTLLHRESKPLKTMREGIKINLGPPDIKQMSQAVKLLFAPNWAPIKFGYRLHPKFKTNPILLNVGRLAEVKQQVELFEAWSGSELWKTHNLVFIGGNLENPSDQETLILSKLKQAISSNPHVSGRVALIPALSNAQVRELENAIMALLPTEYPHCYVSASSKEEFGIAIVEAMSAGLLAFGPVEGGVPSYLTDQVNGFTMDTSKVSAISKTLTESFEKRSANELRQVAQAGQNYVAKRFDIDLVGDEFATYYSQILSIK